MTFTKDDLDFARNMRNAVTDKGRDYVYPGASTGSCFYLEYADDVVGLEGVPTGVPSCIVGHGLLPVTGMALLQDSEFTGAVVVMGSFAARHWDFSHGVSIAATAAQSAQDDGFTWGVAWDRFVYEVIHETGSDITAYLDE